MLLDNEYDKMKRKTIDRRIDEGKIFACRYLYDDKIVRKKEGERERERERERARARARARKRERESRCDPNNANSHV